jgi:hypothetical protein
MLHLSSLDRQPEKTVYWEATEDEAGVFFETLLQAVIHPDLRSTYVR